MYVVDLTTIVCLLEKMTCCAVKPVLCQGTAIVTVRQGNLCFELNGK